MKTTLHQRPSVSVRLLDMARRPLAFTAKRLAMLQSLQAELPELPILCEVNGQVRTIQLETIELWDMRMLYLLNTSVV